LREPIARLNEVDFLVVQETDQALQSPLSKTKKPFYMQLQPQTFQSTHFPQQTLALSSFCRQKVHAVAGIGNPQRFFDLLTRLQIEFIPHPFPDHHRYKMNDLAFSDQLPLVMTEKDAIKCKRLAFDEASKKKQWFLRVTTKVSSELKHALLELISKPC